MFWVSRSSLILASILVGLVVIFRVLLIPRVCKTQFITPGDVEVFTVRICVAIRMPKNKANLNSGSIISCTGNRMLFEASNCANYSATLLYTHGIITQLLREKYVYFSFCEKNKPKPIGGPPRNSKKSYSSYLF